MQQFEGGCYKNKLVQYSCISQMPSEVASSQPVW